MCSIRFGDFFGGRSLSKMKPDGWKQQPSNTVIIAAHGASRGNPFDSWIESDSGGHMMRIQKPQPTHSNPATLFYVWCVTATLVAVTIAILYWVIQ
jgi:hypothetical protein